MKITLTLYNSNDNGKDINDRIYVPDWPAEPCGVPGLCICKAAIGIGDKFVPWEHAYHRYYWHIIHIKSGLAVITDIYFKRDAQRMALKLIGPDWTADADKIMGNKEYGSVVKKAKDDYLESLPTR